MGSIEFKLVCGVGAAINDTQSVEEPLQLLDLLAGVYGFSVDIDGWTPQTPQIKNGGVWADSAITDGRDLLFGTVGNVVETITLTSANATTSARYALEKKLYEFSRLARDFWQTDWQIEPIYLKWQADCSCAPQYALVYKIDIAPRTEAFGGDTVGEVVISIEREPYWRAVRPGGHPKEYTFFSRGFQPGIDWNYTDLEVATTNDNLVDGTVYCEHSWNTGKTAHGLINFIDIDGELIPGDAPALVYFALTPYRDDFVFLARSTKPTVLPQRTGDSAYSAGLHNLWFNAGDGQLGTNASYISTSDGTVRAVNQTRTVVSIGFTTATMVDRLYWNGEDTIAADGEPLSQALQRGKFMCFLVCEQTGGGSVGDIDFQLEFDAGLPTPITLPVTSPTLTTEMVYAGTINIPLVASRIAMDVAGRGAAAHLQSRLVITLQASGVLGLALRVYALVLIPIDEICTQIYQTNGDDTLHYDTSGYLTHGRDAAAYTQDDAPVANTIEGAPEIRGGDLALVPGVTNRVYIIHDYAPNQTVGVHVNIVPRWSGARDDCPLLGNGTLNGYTALTDEDDLILLDEDGFVLTE